MSFKFITTNPKKTFDDPYNQICISRNRFLIDKTVTKSHFFFFLTHMYFNTFFLNCYDEFSCITSTYTINLYMLLSVLYTIPSGAWRYITNLIKLTLYKHVLNCLSPKLNKIQKFLITKTVICIIIHVWAQLDHAKYALQPSW